MHRAPRTAIAASLAAVALISTLAGCRDRESQAANDSALSRDLTLATAVATPPPALQDVPDTVRAPGPPTPARSARTPPRPARTQRRTPAPAPAPVAPQPAPVETPAPVVETPAAEAPVPARNLGIIASGTSVGLTIGSRACSDGNRPGDKMVARTAEAITGTNGVVFPAGSPVVIEIASIVESSTPDSSSITFRVKSITANDETYPVTGDVIPTGTLEKTRVEGKTSDKKKVIGGAILGAVIGQVVGGDTKGTVIGAAAGAAAGTAAAARGTRYQSCLPAGATLRLTFTEPLEIGV